MVLLDIEESDSDGGNCGLRSLRDPRLDSSPFNWFTSSLDLE